MQLISPGMSLKAPELNAIPTGSLTNRALPPPLKMVFVAASSNNPFPRLVGPVQIE